MALFFHSEANLFSIQYFLQIMKLHIKNLDGKAQHWRNKGFLNKKERLEHCVIKKKQIETGFEKCCNEAHN